MRINQRRVRPFAVATVFALACLLGVACSGDSGAPATSSPATAVTQARESSAAATPAGTASVATPAATPTAAASAATAVATTAPAAPQPASAAPECARPSKQTPSQTEGPYFKAGSPERNVLVTAGMAGTRLVLTGFALSADCRPVAGALLDFWQADAAGAYDNTGFTLRGHQFTDAQGRYRLETVLPGEYPGRTLHIHVKVQAPGGRVLTTQLYFPGAARNQSDGIFDAALLVKDVQQGGAGQSARYDFVVAGG